MKMLKVANNSWLRVYDPYLYFSCIQFKSHVANFVEMIRTVFILRGLDAETFSKQLFNPQKWRHRFIEIPVTPLAHSYMGIDLNTGKVSHTVICLHFFVNLVTFNDYIVNYTGSNSHGCGILLVEHIK